MKDNYGHPDPEKALNQQDSILLTFEDKHDGQTAQEAAEECGLWPDKPDCQYQKRCGELEFAGFIQRNTIWEKDGKPVYESRKSPHGNPRCIYRLTEKGYRKMQEVKKHQTNRQRSLPFVTEHLEKSR